MDIDEFIERTKQGMEMAFVNSRESSRNGGLNRARFINSALSEDDIKLRIKSLLDLAIKGKELGATEIKWS